MLNPCITLSQSCKVLHEVKPTYCVKVESFDLKVALKESSGESPVIYLLGTINIHSKFHKNASITFRVTAKFLIRLIIWGVF